MYASTILSKVLVYIYASKTWRSALDVTFEKADDSDYSLSETTVEESWMTCPPPPVVAFAGTLVS